TFAVYRVASIGRSAGKPSDVWGWLGLLSTRSHRPARLRPALVVTFLAVAIGLLSGFEVSSPVLVLRQIPFGAYPDRVALPSSTGARSSRARSEHDCVAGSSASDIVRR